MKSDSFAQKLTELVGVLEKRSSIEVVVVLAARSGSYQDLEHLLAFAGSMLCLLYLIHSPTEFHTDLWVVWLALAYLVTLVLLRRFPSLWRPLTSPGRRHVQCLQQARCAFMEERVASTRDRSGLLVYISQFEREIVFVPDLGVDRFLPQSHFHQVEHRLRETRSWGAFQTRLLTELAGLEEPMAQALPVAADDSNELDNQIRVRR